MYRKDAFAVEAVIGMVESTNHRFRVVTVFRRLDNNAETQQIGKRTGERATKAVLEPAWSIRLACLIHRGEAAAAF